jgi:hypothetical protein
VSDGVIDVTSLHDYLRVREWSLFRNDDRRSIWQHAGSGKRVFIPNSQQSDFDDIIDIAIENIAITEERSPVEVRLDISWAGWDKLSAWRAAPTATLSIADAVDMHLALNDLILSAARAAVDKRRAFIGGRRPRSVDAYMDKVRVLASAPGSFVTRALLPLNAASQETLPMIGPAEPRVREVAVTLMRASQAAVTTAKRFASGEANVDSWDQAIPYGVSANLCDALARLCGFGEDDRPADVSLTVDWTWSKPEAAEVEAVKVPAGLAATLVSGSQYLRDQPDEFMVSLTGLVVRLHRDSPMGAGEVTARGYIDGLDSGPRSLRLELDEVTYRQAISAHDLGHTIHVVALARNAARSLEVIRVESFHTVTPG